MFNFDEKLNDYLYYCSANSIPCHYRKIISNDALEQNRHQNTLFE